MPDTISPSMFNLVSQNAHWLFGSWITLLFVYLMGVKSLYYTIPLLVVGVAIKEFWYDQKYENAVTRGSNLLDFSMYILGAVITLILVAIHYVLYEKKEDMFTPRN